MSYKRLLEEQQNQDQESESSDRQEINEPIARKKKKGKSLIGSTLSEQLDQEVKKAKLFQSVLDSDSQNNESFIKKETQSLVIINYFYDLKKDLKQNFEATISDQMTVQQVIICSIQYFNGIVFKFTGKGMPVEPSCYILRAANKKTGKPKLDWPPFDPNTFLSASGFTHFTLCLKDQENNKKQKAQQIQRDEMPVINPELTPWLDQEIDMILQYQRNNDNINQSENTPQVKHPQKRTCCQKLFGFIKWNKK